MIATLLKDPALFRTQAFIGGAWVGGASTIEVTNPADGSVVGSIPDVGSAGAKEAVDAAAKAFESWKKAMPKTRSQILRKWGELIMEHQADLAMIMTMEQGKPLGEAKGEVGAAASHMEYFSEECKRIYGDIIPNDRPDRRFLVRKEPVGVVAAITPWNFPSAMITRKCAPAIAAGCTVVLKPSEMTPYSALALCVLAERAGLPAGVLNVVTGMPGPIGQVLTESKVVRKLGFTGSTRVGKLLMAQCAGTVKKVSLELGGHAPCIIMDDADLDVAVTGVMNSKYRNAGQTCVSSNRILVQSKVYSAFVEKLSKAVSELKVGKGSEGSTTMGPLINSAAIEKVDIHVKDAVANGAKVVLGGKQPEVGGNFYEPTVLTNCNLDMLIAREETFGPVAALIPFDTEEQAISIANNSDYGLAAYLFSRDVGRIFRISEALEYGLVGVNDGNIAVIAAPFGGMKQSGIGREGSKYGMDEFMEMKYICLSGL